MTPVSSMLTSDERIGALLDVFLPRLVERAESTPRRYVADNRHLLDHVVDWLVADLGRDAGWLHRRDALGRPVKLAKIVTLEAALKEADKAMRRAADILRSQGGLTASAEDPVFEDLGGGWTIVELKTPEALDRESAMMGHCLGAGSYDARLGTERFLSLRDPSGAAHATLEIEGGTIVQLKGKQNKAPVFRYVEMLIPTIERENLILEERPHISGLVQEPGGRLHPVDAIPQGTTLRSLDLTHTKIERLPVDLVVLGHMKMANTAMTRLPDGLSVGGDLVVGGMVEDLPARLVVEGSLFACFTRIPSLPSDLKVRERIVANGTTLARFVQTTRDADGYIVIPEPEPERSFAM